MGEGGNGFSNKKNCNFGGAGLPKVNWSKRCTGEPFSRLTYLWPILGGSIVSANPPFANIIAMNDGN